MGTAAEADESRQMLAPESQERRCCDCDWGLAEYGAMHLEGKSRDVSKGGSEHVTDETISTMVHFVGLMLSILGTAVLVGAASVEGKVWHIIGFSIYGATLIMLFLASTLHHGVHSNPKVEQDLLLFDYIAIFPLIAGTFTPICLVCLHDHWSGWVFLGSVWFIAITGMVLIGVLREKFPRWISFTMYITLGWMGAFLVLFAFERMGLSFLLIVAFGGVLYTVGGVVFVVEKPNPYPGYFGFHEIWHIFVLLAAATHWCVMYFWVLPYPY